MAKSLKFLRALRDCRRGSIATEYALIASLLGAGLIVAIVSLGGAVNDQFAATVTAVADAS